MRNKFLILGACGAAAIAVLGVATGAMAQAWNTPALSPVASPNAPRPVATGPAVDLSLTEAVALGLRDNPTIRSAYLTRVAQKFDLVVAETRFLPRAVINAGVSEERIAGQDASFVDLAPTAQWLTPTGAAVSLSWTRSERRGDGPADVLETITLNVAQPLLKGAGLAVNAAPIEIARLQEEINRLGLEATVSDTVTSIVFAYRALAQAQEQLRLAELALERTQELLTVTEALIEAGRVPAADIVQTQSGVANQEVALLQARQQKASAQLALLQLLALDLRTDVVAADAIEAQQVVIDIDQAVALGLGARTDVLAQRKALEQDRQDLMVARNNRLWDLSLVGTVSRFEANGVVGAGLDDDLDSRVGLQLSIPLGDYAPRQGEVSAATTLRRDEVQLEALTRAVEAQILDAVQNLEGSWRQLEAARRARALSAQALELQRERLQAGRSSNFEVLSFQADLRAADTQELTAIIAYLNALTTLDQQLGTTLDTWRIDLND